MLISPGREITLGAAVLAVGIGVLAAAYASSGREAVKGYDLMARFNKAEGIGIGSEVRLSGLAVGKVVQQELDERFRAVVTMRLPEGVTLPGDSAALIQTDGLLGAKYIALQPGAEDAMLKPGQEFAYTQDSVNVRDLLELIIDQAQGKAAAEGAAEGAAAPKP